MTNQPEQTTASLPPFLPTLDDDSDRPANGTACDVAETRVAVIELRGSGGLGLFLRVGEDSRLYRVAPVRDPHQPRFWCLAAFECSSCGIPTTGTAVWAGSWGSAQHELAGLLAAIKADANGWLAEESRAALRQFLLRPRPPLPLPVARVARRAAANHEDVMIKTTDRAS